MEGNFREGLVRSKTTKYFLSKSGEEIKLCVLKVLICPISANNETTNKVLYESLEKAVGTKLVHSIFFEFVY